jgi:hypothetical protein
MNNKRKKKKRYSGETPKDSASGGKGTVYGAGAVCDHETSNSSYPTRKNS